MQTLEKIMGLFEPIGLNFFGDIPIWLRIALIVLGIILIFASMNKIDDEDTSQVFFMATILRFIMCAVVAIASLTILHFISVILVILIGIILGYKNRSVLVGITMSFEMVLISEFAIFAIEWVGLKILSYIVQFMG